jgi:glyoxylase-like metal-dependent hydrolase (beta-lactamase superfamily II)
MKARIFAAGYCTGPGKVADKSLPWRKLVFPAPFALIEHPEHGRILFDTGYHPRFYDCTRRLPEKIMAWSTPCYVSDNNTATSILGQHGVEPATVQHLVLSHLHADHVAGSRDFSQATLYCHPHSWRFISNNGRFALARKGYLPRLLPDDFETRCRFVSEYAVPLSELFECEAPLNDLWANELWANDLFSDGSIYLVDLPGHASGHVGMLCRLAERWLFLLADACWLLSNLQPGHEPHAFASLIFSDTTAFNETLASLQYYYRNTRDTVDFVPSHCEQTISAVAAQGWLS